MTPSMVSKPGCPPHRGVKNSPGPPPASLVGSGPRGEEGIVADATTPPVEGAPSTRGDRKAQTQARIVEAAISLFAVRGYERTTIAAVAGRARVSRSAVFWHFGDKETLFLEAFRRMLVPFVHEMRATLEGRDPIQRIYDLIEVYERFVDGQSQTIQSMVQWFMESPSLRQALRTPLLGLHDEFTKDVEESLVDLLEEPGEARVLAHALVALLDGNLILSFLEGDPAKDQLRSAGVRRLVERALQGQKA